MDAQVSFGVLALLILLATLHPLKQGSPEPLSHSEKSTRLYINYVNSEKACQRGTMQEGISPDQMEVTSLMVPHLYPNSPRCSTVLHALLSTPHGLSPPSLYHSFCKPSRALHPFHLSPIKHLFSD